MKVFLLHLYSLLIPLCCLGQELDKLYLGYSENPKWNSLKMETSLILTSDTTAKLFFGYRAKTIGIPSYRDIDYVFATYKRQENKLVLKLSNFLLKPPVNNHHLQILKDERVEIIDYFNDFIAKNKKLQLHLTKDSCLIDEKNKMIYISARTRNLIKQKYPKDAIIFAYNNQKIVLYDRNQDTSKLFKEIEEGFEKKHITSCKIRRGLSSYKQGGIDGVVLGIVEFYNRKSLLRRWFGRKE